MNLLLIRSRSIAASLILAAVPLTTTVARATVTAADRGWFITDATVRGKGASTTLHIWQQLHSGDWVDTGLTVDTDGSGNGHGWETHSTGIGAFHDGRPTVTGSATAPNPVQVLSPYLASALPAPINGTALARGVNSPVPIRLANSRTDGGGHLFLETWNPGTIISLRLNPAQAQFMPGPVTITCPGVPIQTMSVTPTDVTFRIMGNGNPMAPSTIVINGVGLMVTGAPGTSVDLMLDGQGSSAAFRDGQFLEQTQFVFGQILGVVQSLGIAGGCPVDLNGDGQVSVADYLRFLQLYSAGDARADVNGDGLINVQDYLFFLSLYSRGCN
jgi:hypothetical protein